MKKNQYYDSKTRRFAILSRLVQSEHLSYQQLSEEYLVSRSSIANDITAIKTLLAKEAVSLTFDNSGTYFDGNESQIQRVLKRLILNHITDSDLLKPLVDQSLFEKINQALRQGLEEKDIEIPESYVQSIVISVLLIVQRGKAGYKISLEGKNQYGKLFLEFNKYPLVYELLKKIEEQQIYHFSSEEVQYLTYLIVGSGIKFFLKKEVIPLSFRGKVRQLIQKVSEGIQIDVTQDARLEEDMLVHLYQLILRMEANTTIVNPLLAEIKNNYPAVYGVVWFALNEFCTEYQKAISEDEVGFVSIHFQAAIERKKKLNKILFVCPNGVGTSSFVSAKIRRILPDVDSIETASIAKLKQLDLTDIDFIISTVDIAIAQKPVVKISPMVTAKDMKRIMNDYIDFVIDNEQEKVESQDIPASTKRILEKSIFFESLATKEAAIHYLVDQCDGTNQAMKEAFIQSVFERENIQSTYLDNGFAIPHGNPKFVEKTAISLVILDKPIHWGNQKVDVVVLLMIREEDVKEVEPVMKLVMQGIKDKSWFILKMMEVKR